MTYYVSSGTLNPTHSLTHCAQTAIYQLTVVIASVDAIVCSVIGRQTQHALEEQGHDIEF